MRTNYNVGSTKHSITVATYSPTNLNRTAKNIRKFVALKALPKGKLWSDHALLWSRAFHFLKVEFTADQ